MEITRRQEEQAIRAMVGPIALMGAGILCKPRFRSLCQPWPKDPKNETGGWAGDGKYNYSYFSDAGYGCPDRRWYLIVYKLENPDMASPGVYACDGTFFNYSGTITIGINGVL